MHGAALLALAVLRAGSKLLGASAQAGIPSSCFQSLSSRAVLTLSRCRLQPGVVVLGCNPCVGEAEAGVQGQRELPSEFKAAVGHLRSILKDTNEAEH